MIYQLRILVELNCGVTPRTGLAGNVTCRTRGVTWLSEADVFEGAVDGVRFADEEVEEVDIEESTLAVGR